MSSLINLRDVTKVYGNSKTSQVVLNHINFHIAQGELVAIMGPSGSGKSTLMNIIGLLDRPTSGSYFLKGQEVSTVAEEDLAKLRNRMIGFVFQSFFLLPRLTVLQNVGLPLFYRSCEPHEIKTRSLALLEKVEMARFADRKPNQLSGGQQQRVAIARALVGQPEVILADEPTGSLDSQIGQEIMDLFIHLNRRENATIVIVTHDPKVASQCNKTIRIADGKILMPREKPLVAA